MIAFQTTNMNSKNSNNEIDDKKLWENNITIFPKNQYPHRNAVVQSTGGRNLASLRVISALFARIAMQPNGSRFRPP